MCTAPNLHGGCAFLSLVGHYQQFIKGFACITQLLNENLAGEGASRKLEQVLLPEDDTLKAFDTLKQAVYDHLLS